MANKPVKVLADLQTRRQILKLDSSGNVLFKVSGSLGNGVVLVELPMTASAGISARLYGTASYALNAATASYLEGGGGGGGISSVFTSGSITGSGLEANPVVLKDPLVLNTVTASVGFSGYLYGTASFASNAASASFASTASYAENSGLSVVSTSGSITGSGVIANPITLKDPLVIGAVTASLGFSGNLYGTASYANAATSASFATTASYAANANIDVSSFPTRTEVSGAITSSLAPYATLFGVSASFATPTQITSALTPYATTGSNTFVANQIISGNLDVAGTLTAQQLQITYVTSSVIYTSGSTKFGDSIDDTHQFTGSLFVTGNITANNFFGTASFAQQALSASFATTASYAETTNIDISQFSTRAEVSGAITSSLVPYATLAGVSSSFATPAQVTGALSNYVTVSNFNLFSGSYNTGSFSGSLLGTASFATSASFATTASYAEAANIDISQFSTRAEVSGAITSSLTPYATLNGVSASFATPAQVSASITGSLVPYATLAGVSASFTTPAQITGALSPYALLIDVSSSFVDNSELTSAIANFPTRPEVSGAITASLVPYATLTGLSASFASLSANNTFTGINSFNNSITGTNAYFSGNITVNGTASIGVLNYTSASSLSIGDKYIILASGSADHTSLDGSGILWGSGSTGPTIGPFGENAHILYRNSGDYLEIFPGVSASFISSSFVGNLAGNASTATSASFATNAATASFLTGFNQNDYATLVGVSASFTTPTQITSALAPYALATDVSASFVDNLELTSAIGNFATRTEVSGAITASLVPYATLAGVSSSFATPAQITGALSVYALSADVSASFVDNSELTSAISTFPSRTEVSGAITASLTPYATLSGVSGTFAAITDVSASFTTPAQITGALTNYVTTTTFNTFSGSYNTGSFSGSLLGTASFALTASFAQNSSISTSAVQNAYNRLRYQVTGNFDVNGSATITLPATSLGGNAFPTSSFEYVSVAVTIKDGTRWINDLLSVQLYTSSTNIYVELSAPALTNTNQYKLIAVNENSADYLII